MFFCGLTFGQKWNYNGHVCTKSDIDIKSKIEIKEEWNMDVQLHCTTMKLFAMALDAMQTNVNLKSKKIGT